VKIPSLLSEEKNPESVLRLGGFCMLDSCWGAKLTVADSQRVDEKMPE
jgi:hypothetical protein